MQNLLMIRVTCAKEIARVCVDVRARVSVHTSGASWNPVDMRHFAYLRHLDFGWILRNPGVRPSACVHLFVCVHGADLELST